VQGNQQLTLVREYRATPEAVWNAWATPEGLSQWYGSPGKLTDVSIDFQPGGAWTATTSMPNGDRYPQKGVYTIIEDEKHLQFRFVDPDTSGSADYEIMDIVLEQDNEDPSITRMTFVQTGDLPPDEYANGLKKGWTGFFDQLKTVVEV
jgi:uncharacterized protein YndB with AHSA1/START domain